MAERCSDCGNDRCGVLQGGECAVAQMAREIRGYRARIAKLEAVVEAQAKVIEAADAIRYLGPHMQCLAYDAAKAELERVKG